MKFILASALLVAAATMAAASSPQQPVVSTEIGKSPHSAKTLWTCIAAHNCEIYETDIGTMIRFIPGMEPGSDDYKSRFANESVAKPAVNKPTVSHYLNPGQAAAAQSGDHSIVTFGNTNINYGSINPSNAVYNLYNTCDEGSCDPAAYSVDTQDIYRTGANSGPRGRILTLYPSGQYNGLDERNNFVNAVVAAASIGQVWTQYNWSIRTKEGDDTGTMWESQQTDFISVSQWSGNNLQGFISVKVVMDDGNDSECASFGAIAAAVAGALNPIAGGFFGLVSAICS